ncbi:MAG: IS200/IS605 family transposase [Candidatus Micrarchaeia archaeon]
MVGVNEFHFEFCPKYRYNCMRKAYINKEIKNLIRKVADEYGIIIKCIAIAEDHIHIFAAIPFSMSCSKALNLLKGRSAYLIFRRFPNFRKRYPKAHFWARGKFSKSISGITSETVERYVEEQQFSKLHETMEQARIEQQSLINYLD